jgi:imidazolonepropionase-like amidohydrolase
MASSQPEGVQLIRAGRLITVSDRGELNDGGVAIRGGRIVAVGSWDEVSAGFPGASMIDCSTYVVAPGLVDPHTHNLEFGPGTAWNVGQRAQFGGAASLLFDALRAGVTALGEHVLGHYQFARQVAEYRALADQMPQRIRLGVGTCCVGTEPMAYLTALDPGGSRDPNVLLEDSTLRKLAEMNEFPGESCFVTSTTANLPVEAAPNADLRMIDRKDLKRVIDTYHDAGQRVGAHLEGLEPARDFVELGGNVIHHGFGIPDDFWPRMAEADVTLCATPGAGTGWQPNSPDEIAAAVGAGVRVGIATDAVIPQSGLATWYETPSGSLIRSTDLMRIAAPGLRRLVSDGASNNDALALLTLNSASILGLDDVIGSIEEGKYADLVVVDGLPGVEATDPSAVKGVMMEGDLLVGELQVSQGESDAA